MSKDTCAVFEKYDEYEIMVEDVVESLRLRLLADAKKLFNSGMVNTEQYCLGEYLLAKVLVASAMQRDQLVRGVEGLNSYAKADLRNLIKC